MKCPKCEGELQPEKHMKMEVEKCDQCHGMWLDPHELDELEDKKFDADDYKGTLAFSSKETEHVCPKCQKNLKSFQYRLHDLELEYCEDHGYWLDENEEKRVLELMKKEKEQTDRKFEAEEEWTGLLKKIKSNLFKK